MAISKKLLMDEPGTSTNDEKGDSKEQNDGKKADLIEEEKKEPIEVVDEKEEKKAEGESTGEKSKTAKDDENDAGRPSDTLEAKTRIDKAKIMNLLNSHLPEDIRIFGIWLLVTSFSHPS